MLVRFIRKIAPQSKFEQVLRFVRSLRLLFSWRSARAVDRAYRLFQLGQLMEAEQLLLKTLDAKPREFQALYLLGEVKLAAGNFENAIKYYQLAADINPSHTDLRTALGFAFADQGRLDESLRELSEVVRLAPDNACYWNNLGMCHLRCNRLKDAWQCVGKALELDAALPEAWCNKGILQQEFRRPKASIECFQKAVQLDPLFVSGWSNLGLSLKGEERYDEAVEAFEKALSLNPEHADSLNNLGATERERGNTALALTYVRKALQHNPALPQAYCNLGEIFRDFGNIEEATKAFQQAKIYKPDFPEAEVSLGLIHLAQGDFRSGWLHYETRKRSGETPFRDLPFPEWDGSTVQDKTILIYGEQGLGDEIMFASCYSEVIDRAKRCIIECDPRLASLFARSFRSAEIWDRRRTGNIDWLQLQAPVDVQLPAGSLPSFFRNDWPAFPQHSGYLAADVDCVKRWQEKLAGLGSGLKIGIAWKGGLGKTRRHFRSIQLSEWAPILTTPGCHFVSLQYGSVTQDLDECDQACGVKPHHWDATIENVDELAGLITALDLVISVCNSWVHLSGALGKPAWVLVPKIPEWRYLLEGERLPWYPSAKLFRQQVSGQWDEPIKRVQEALVSYGSNGGL